MPKASVVKALSTKTIFSQTKLMNPEAMEAPGKKNIKNAIIVSGVRTLYFSCFLKNFHISANKKYDKSGGGYGF